MLAVALLPPIECEKTRAQVRADLEWCMLASEVPQQLREFGVVAAGLRTRDDPKNARP